MVDPKKSYFLTLSLLAVFLWSLIPSSVSAASKSQYFDFGPYYSQGGVLGFSFSALENLPVPSLPDNIIPKPATGIMPGSTFYPFERLWENAQLTFTFDPAKKEELRLDLATEKLSEAKTLMEQGKTEAMLEALSDYSQTMTAVAQNLTVSTAAQVEKTAAAQSILTQSLSLSAPPAQAESWNQALDRVTQALDKAAEVTGAPAIPEQLSSKIQQLKTDGLISEEESNKIYGLRSRSEVRNELDKLTFSGQFPMAELSKLDTAVAKQYPEVHKAMEANLQVAELRSYQSQPQPPDKALEELNKWQKDPSVPPSNTIKPYLWYNRAQDLAKDVDLSNFTPEQQTDVAKFYPQAVTENPTYSPPPSPSPSPSPASTPAPSDTPAPSPAADQTTTQQQPTDQTASPSPGAAPANTTAQFYIGGTGGAVPGDSTYFIKRWNEDLSSTFTFDPAEKARLKMQQAERRLAEARAISEDPKKISLYESTLKDYQNVMTQAATFLKDAGESKKAREAAKQLETQAARHEVVWEKGLLPAPKDSKLISEAIKTTENVMDQSADTLGRPAVPPALVVRLGDLKAQGLILPEEADDLTRSASRTETREKIRELVKQDFFPTADAKKLDEAQILNSPTEYNQLVEVRKVEELQKLRAVQTDFAQTPTLKATATTLGQKEASLLSSIELALITEADLKGRDDLVKTYQTLKDQPRPINSGQFGADVKPGATPAPAASPRPADAVLSTCPAGAIFKQYEGCVWADSGKKLNDYDQYKCEGPRQYYSFAAKKCVPYDSGSGFREDAQPICPLGYTWNWQSQACTTSPGGTLILPIPKPEPGSKTCPEGAAYQEPDGCVWDDNGKKINDAGQYRCGGRSQYYSFEKRKCVPAPKTGEEYPEDASPNCQEENSSWSWSEGKCIKWSEVVSPLEGKDVPAPKVTFVAPDSPFYFLKQTAETVQLATAFTPEAKQQVRIAQANERLAEGFYALSKDNEGGFKQALSSYTARMQDIYNDLGKASLSEAAKGAISESLSKKAVEQNLLLQKADALAKDESSTAISAAISATILGVDKAADLAGEPPIPAEVKAKIEALPKEMMPEEVKTKLLETSSRVDARLSLPSLAANGALTQEDTAFLDEDFESVNQGARLKLVELKKLEDITAVTKQKEEVTQKIEKNEEIVGKLTEFEKTFEPGKEIPAEVRPYVRLTRINEVAQTIRPDVVKLEGFQNRKDVVLAVVTLQEEFRPTRQNIQQVVDFRRRNPNAALPSELARIEALSFSLGVRDQAAACFLPTPPFPANTPCPAPGAAIPIVSFTGGPAVNVGEYRPGWSGAATAAVPSTDKDGKQFVYGQGPKSEGAGVCPAGFHWMYDSGGWCMSDSGSYGSSSSSTAYSGSAAPGYTPYSQYYTAPGAPPATYGYQGAGSYNVYTNAGSPYPYSPPSYWGPASTIYTTTPPSGTVPGTGPQPNSSGQCPTGYHWMSPSGNLPGWCMSDGPTYVPSSSGAPLPGVTTSDTPPPGGYNCGSQSYDPVTKKCRDGACPGGYNWDGSKCVAPSPNLTQSSCGPGYYWSNGSCFPNPSSSSGGGGYSTSSSYQYGCTPGYYWDGSKCVSGNYSGGGWSDAAARTQSWCQPPSSGCGSNSYWDYGSCYCRSSSTYSGGSGPSTGNQCQGLSCGGGAWLDYATCSCRYSGSTSGSSGGLTCYPPSAGCPGGWYDYSTCSCKTSSSTTPATSAGSTYTGGSCSFRTCGSNEWFDWGTCSCRTSSTTTTTSGSTTTSSGSTTTSSGSTTSPGSSSGSCPSGYHWMSEGGGYCMQDGGGGGGGGGGGTTSTPSTPTTSTTTTTTSTPTTSEPAPAPAAPPPSEPAPAPAAPPPSEPAPAPQPAGS